MLDTVSAPVVLVGAPRGCGKTVLLAQWLRQRRDTRWCWVSASRYDSPAGFWLSLTKALRPLLPESRDLEPTDRATLLDDVVPNLVNTLATADPLTIVIDGVDAVTDPLTVESFDLFVRWLPESVRLVVSTARPARGPIATLRASGRLGELGESDLRFTDDEARHLLSVVSGEPVGQARAATLNGHVDGWAVGLRLTAPAMSGADTDPGTPVPAVVDYLRAEILDRLSPDEQRFLAHTSVLSELTAQACAALVGPDADTLLTGLADSTLFVRRHQPGTYTLHPVLRGVLSTGLAAQQPELARDLHERAARWSRRHGTVSATVRHAMAARRRDIALAVLLERWPAARPDDVLGWLAAIQADTVYDGRLRRIKAAAELANGDAGQTLNINDPADAGLRALLHLRRGDLTRAGNDAATATTVEGEPWCTAIRRLALGSVWLWRGRPADAYAELNAAAEAARSIDYTFVLVRALDAASVCAALTGRTREAGALAAEAIAAGGETAVLACAVLALHGDAPAVRSASVLTTHEPHQQAYRWWVAAELARTAGDRHASRSACARGRSLLSGVEPGATLACLLRPTTSPPATTDCRDPVTDRELVVLRALRGPLTLREIADELHLSHNTVKTHVRAVFRKLDTHSRKEAVAAAETLGLLPHSASRWRSSTSF